ncbi:MAG: hypothetical protein ABIO86_17150 [Sphingomonas sp.]
MIGADLLGAIAVLAIIIIFAGLWFLPPAATRDDRRMELIKLIGLPVVLIVVAFLEWRGEA